MKNFLFDGLTVRGRALNCLQQLWAVLSHNGERKAQPRNKRMRASPPSQNKDPLVEHRRVTIAASLLTPSPPDPSPQVVLYADALAAMAAAPPGELVLIATIPPGTVLTTALLNALDLKVIHKDQLADLVGWGFVRVEPK